MNRTSEFFDTVKVLKAASPDANSSHASRPASDPQSQRMRKASRSLADGLKSTASLIARVHKLAAKRGLFADPSSELAQLTGVVKAHMHEHTEALGRIAGVAGEMHAQSREHWLAVAELLRLQLVSATRRLQSALRAAAKSAEQREKQRGMFTKSRWKPVVSLDNPLFSGVSDGLPQSKRPAQPPQPPTSRSQHSPPLSSSASASASTTAAAAASASSGPPSGGAGAMYDSGGYGAGAGAGGGSGPRRRHVGGGGGVPPPPAPHPNSAGAPSGAVTGKPQYKPRYPSGGYASQQVYQMRGQQQNSEVKQYEKVIAEMGQLFTQLVTLVSSQAEVVNRIEEDIEAADSEIKAGNLHLWSYYHSVQTNRAFILKLFGVLIFMILLFAMLNRS